MSAKHKFCSICSNNIDRSHNTFICVFCHEIDHANCTIIKGWANRVIDYYCDKCRSTSRRHRIKFKLPDATPEQALDKLKNHYVIDRIVDHAIDTTNNKRSFRVHWLGYSEAERSWIEEEEFYNAFNTLQDYCIRNNLPLSGIEGTYGASNSVMINEDNWVTIKEVLKQYKILKKIRKLELDLEEFNNFGPKTSLFTYGYENHLYVMFYNAEMKCCYVADGGNRFRDEIYVKSHIENLDQDIQFIPCTYDQQFKVDHCASSAVLIGVCFSQAFKAKRSYQLLTSDRSLRERVKKLFHKKVSSKMNKEKSAVEIFRTKKFACETCGSSFKTYRALHAHKISCKSI